jgi:hypothetical protein
VLVGFVLRFLLLPAPAKFGFEVKISFAKLGVEHSPGMKIGWAFDVTDANGKADQKAFLRPTGSKIESPKTWGVAVAE